MAVLWDLYVLFTGVCCILSVVLIAVQRATEATIISGVIFGFCGGFNLIVIFLSHCQARFCDTSAECPPEQILHQISPIQQSAPVGRVINPANEKELQQITHIVTGIPI
jgi:hypothetical protein